MTKNAREIHDTLGHAMTALKLDLAWLKKRLARENAQDPKLQKLAAMEKSIELTIQAIQKISAELRPPVLDSFGLVTALEWQAKEFQARTGIRCELALSAAGISIDSDRSTTVFRIFQETLTNVARHARATRVRISLAVEDGHLLLEVQDNGRGIDPADISNGRSLGILGMKERALAWSGDVTIHRLPQQGTAVAVQIPLGS